MKKILQIISQRPEKTGSGIYLQNILREGEKKGYEQAIVAGVPKENINVDFGNEKPIKYYPVVFESDEISFPVVGMTDVMPYKNIRYRDLTENMLSIWKNAFEKTIKKAVKEFNPDIIICHHLWILTALVKNIFPEIPMIAFCHGTDLRQMELVPKFSEYVKLGCNKVENIIALHESQQEEIIKKYGIDEHKIHILGVGYNPSIFYPLKEEKSLEQIKLVYTGKINYSKGVPYLIDAYNSLKMDNISLTLIGSGNGEEYEDIKNMVRDSKKNIKLTGAIPQVQVAEIFRQSHIFILPSFFEGLPLVLVEALASGLKVVVTDLPGVKQWIGEEVKESGIINYVSLPRLIEVDKPLKEDVPIFKENLKDAIENQINKLINNDFNVNEKVVNRIKDMSWTGIFNRMEKLF